jgi:pimeloyl-ACP methyl ester carboxylesterase
VLLSSACASDGSDPIGSDDQSPTNTEASRSQETADAEIDGPVDIGGRSLYARCTGSGSPTVIMEGGDGDTSSSYAFAEPAISEMTRTCVYDRANLGASDPAEGPRQLSDLVGDLEALLESADVPGPYVLVGTSGGGFITAGFAASHPEEVAGMVFVDTGAPLKNPPKEIVEATDPQSPENVEHRDFLQVERDAWAARRRIGDIPVSVVTARFSPQQIEESPFPAERRAMARNVQRQRGWLVLSPRANQIVIDSGHAIEEEFPERILRVISDVVKAAGPA